MLPSWVDDVWQNSLKGNIHCDDEEFKKHRIPPLYNLNICITGINNAEERQNIAKLVTDNGGKYSGLLRLKSTHILICDSASGVNSEKYKAARRSGSIKCVNIDWVKDSVKLGYALPDEDYPVKKITSTPTKDGENVDPNFSVMSAITISHNASPSKSCLYETIANATVLNNKMKGSTGAPSYKDLVDNLDVKVAKKSGPFLDGCSVSATNLYTYFISTFYFYAVLFNISIYFLKNIFIFFRYI